MKTFDVVIRCHIGMLSTVCALGENDERVEIVSVNATSPAPVVRRSRRRNKSVGKMDVSTAVRQVLADGKPRPYTEIVQAAAKLHGFEPKSGSAALSKLKTLGQVESLGAGIWRKKGA